MPHPSRHTAKRRLLTAAAVLLAVLLAAGAAGYGLFTGSITDRDSVVCIPENTSFEALCDTLSAEGRITRPGRFRIVARAMGADRKIRSGRYELHAGMSAHRIVSMLRSGSQTPLRVTFNNIRTMPQLASVLGRQLRADSAAFAAMLLDDSVAARYGFRPEEFIGMFIPDTYEVYWTVSPDAFAERMNRSTAASGAVRGRNVCAALDLRKRKWRYSLPSSTRRPTGRTKCRSWRASISTAYTAAYPCRPTPRYVMQ